MKKQFFFSVLLCLSIVGVIAWSCKSEAEVPLYGDITGTVKDVKTSALVEGAVVSIASGTETRSVTTQTDGAFSFKKIEPGTVQLKVTKDKYEIYTQSVKITAGENTPVTASLQPKLAQLDISPATIDFTGAEVSKVIYLKNATGSGTVGFTVKPNENWMTVSPASGTVRDNQTVTLTVTVDRKGLAFGNYTGSIVFNADNNSIIYNVTMQIPNPNAPSVTTNDPTNITQTSAEIIGNLTNLGGGSVTQRGHCWSENSNPTVTDNRTTLGAGLVGAFSSSITGLASGKTYYVRAYATNSSGTGYSETKIFKTSTTPTPPAVSIGVVSDITTNAAKVTGNITNIGGANVTEHGHCYDTSPNPTINNTKTTFGPTNAAQAITSSFTNLKQGTKYFVRTYATNTVGTSYSNELSFETTVPVTPPAITTGAVSNIGQTAATVSATVSNLGSSPVIQHGFCWSTTNANPTIADTKNQRGTLSATGAFTSTLSLNKGTNYYLRPYLQTQDGKTYYGSSTDATTTEAGLVLYYPFNGDTNDESGNGNHSKAQNGAKLSLDRYNNPEKSIDLNKGYLLFNNSKLGTLTNEITMSFWTKISQTNFSGTYKVLIGQTSNDCFFRGAQVDGFMLYVDPKTNNKLNFMIGNYNKPAFTTPVFEQNAIVGEWHHITFSKKGTDIKFYLDGVLIKTIVSPYSSAASYINSNFRLGDDWYCFEDEPFIAQIDDFRIYTYALSDVEVANVAKR